MEIFKKLVKFFGRNYWFFLGIIVVISYGQLLFMQPWEDDNALFFKLANIEGPAGYLGTGPFGEGAYKYTAVPYIPIYNFFGHNPFLYFAFGLTFYFFATLVVYKVFSSTFDKAAGKLVGFLYASGYIASDGIIRIFNSVVTSVSVILVGLLFFFYWKFFKGREAKWYFLSLLTFFLATEFAISRTHYLIAVVVLFELLFLAFEKPLKSLFVSVLRILPFILIFYQYFVTAADARSGQVKNLILALARGDFYQTYSLVSSLANVVTPDWLTGNLFEAVKGGILSWLILAGAIILMFRLFWKHPHKKILLPLFVLSMTIWKFSVNDIYFSSALNLGESQLFVTFLGGVILLLFLCGWIVLKTDHMNNSYKNIYIFFFSWVVLNIAAYAAYNPTFSYISINRYLSHSFFAWVSLLGVLYLVFKNTIWKWVFLSVALLWGVGNISYSVVYQQKILNFRSNPVRDFYTQLKSYVPLVEKGDVFYFDVAQDAQSYFRYAFSVAQMPEETAIAWRYGIDRYDIRRITKFEDLVKLVSEGSFADIKKNKVPLKRVYTFFYSSGGLFNTTSNTSELLASGGKKEEVFSGKLEGEDELTVPLTSPIKSVVPSELEITLTAGALDPKELKFPYIRETRMENNSIAKNDKYRKLAFAYKRWKEIFFQNVSATTSSQWQDNITGNVADQNTETFWRAHRVEWPAQGATLTLDLKQVIEIDRFVWVNGLGSSTPARYEVETSTDNIHWQEGREIISSARIDTKEPQVVSFFSRRARFVRMVIGKTTNSDSPGVAEAWVVPDAFSALDAREVEEFLASPFGYVPSKGIYMNSLSELGSKGFIQVYWKGDKKGSLTTEAGQGIDVTYDGVRRNYKVVLPAGGTQITLLKLTGIEIPGTFALTSIKARPLSIKEADFQ